MGHIVVSNLRKEYYERRRQKRKSVDASTADGNKIIVLDDINLEFKDGEMVCILGPSGCGKSTMLRIIAGFDKPSSGSVNIDDKFVAGPSSEHIFVFQHNALLPWMTVWQNMELGVKNLKLHDKKDERIQEYIDIIELEGFEHHYPHQLSGGMQRRAELARAIVGNPESLFMDEPFTGLDFFTHMKMREEVVNMHDFLGKTIVLVTHDINDALIMGDRIIILSGRPTQVKMDRKLDFPRPRKFEKMPELSKLRDEVFFMLGVHGAV